MNAKCLAYELFALRDKVDTEALFADSRRDEYERGYASGCYFALQLIDDLIEKEGLFDEC